MHRYWPALGLVLLVACGGGGSHVLPRTASRPVPADMLNPSVSPQTETKTICTKGWTATIRPPLGFTQALKGRQIASYGYADKTFSHYEEDHAIPLELGGAPSAAANLWPEPHRTSFSDDHQENALRQQVCSHTLTLEKAQTQILALKVSHGYKRGASVR